ncbi:WXG100 family type VII secretion target [Nocardia sp. NBC_00416]|uniref:WXG100 family type VII secretion target n=1 Tax=Nocardia sp. NBC_00416 TaxID=2975991 RepID=UPI002E2306BF
MAGQVHLSAPEAAAVVDDLMDAVGSIKTTLARITDDIAASGPGWRGDASKACRDALDAWDAEASELNRRLTELTDTVSEGNRTLTSVDASNVDRFTNLI